MEGGVGGRDGHRRANVGGVVDDDENVLLLDHPASGWIANLSGLVENTTLTESGDIGDHDGGLLLYDNPHHMWEGGTPSFVEAAYVATQIWNVLPSVAEQQNYVKNVLHVEFVQQAKHLLSKRQQDIVLESKSNTLSIPVSQRVDGGLLPFGLDYKVVKKKHDGTKNTDPTTTTTTTYLRIGFGIHNLPYHLEALVRVLEETKALS